MKTSMFRFFLGAMAAFCLAVESAWGACAGDAADSCPRMKTEDVEGGFSSIPSSDMGQGQRMASENTGWQASQTIEGAKVPTCQEAKLAGLRAYMEKMKCVLSAYEDDTVQMLTLGFDVPGFGAKGDKVWEYRVEQMIPLDFPPRLRAALWIHPHTAKIYYLIGPWVADNESTASDDGDDKMEATPDEL